MPPLMTPQTGAKRGPKVATAAQQNYLNGRPNQQGGVQPTPVPPANQFSASGQAGNSASTGGGLSASGVSSIPSPSSGPSSNPQSLGMPGFDAGGDVSDPGGVDMGQGQEGQAGDLASAMNSVQQAYQYGMQQLSGGFSANTGVMRPSANVEDNREASGIGAINQPTPKQGMTPGGITQGGFGAPQTPTGNFPTGGATAVSGAYPYNQAQQPMEELPSQARGGSVPSLADGGIVDARNMTPSKEGIKSVTPGQSTSESLRQNAPKLADGGVMPPPASPQPQQPTPVPAGGGVGGSPPPQIMRYLTGADAAPIPQVMQTMNRMQGAGAAAKTVASGQTPQQKFAILQALRKISDTAAAHSKVSLTGNGKLPASLPHAVMFANQKFHHTPSPLHVQFGLKGKPTQKTEAGGSIQSFQDAGSVGPPDPGAPDPTQQMADAGAPSQAPASDDQTGSITMAVTDPQSGSTSQHAITSDQLQALVSQPFDQTLKASSDNRSAWENLVRTLQQAGQSIINTPTPEGGELGTRTTPSGVTTSAYPEGWNRRSDRAVNPGAASAGEPVINNRPGISDPAQTYNAANPQRQLGSPGEPSVADYDRAYGNRMQQNAGLAGRQPNAQEKAAIDKMNEQGGTPEVTASKGAGEQTEALPGGGTRVTEAALHNPRQEQEQEISDVEDWQDRQHARDLSEAIMLKNAGVNPGNIAAGGGRPARSTGARAAKAPRGGGARGGGGRSSHAPRRVYGRGHAGLGTYQEMADGTAQYLGPQNLTG